MTIDKSSFIYSYLPFSDDRIQFLDISDWSGQAIKLNREFYIDLLMSKMKINTSFSQKKNNLIIREIKARTEDVEGVYILIGDDVEGIKEGIVYIGETSDFKQRMLRHFKSESKEFFSEIFFFSKRGKLRGAGLGEALRKAIEANAIRDAKKAERYKVLNVKQRYEGKLNLSEEDALESFFMNIKIILKHLGITIFKEKIMIKEIGDKNYFICKTRGADAVMYRGETGYVVLKDSIIVKEYTESFPKQYKKIFEQRQALIDNEILKEKENGGNFVLLEDQEFPSASGAGDFVTGGHYNGYDIWKKRDNEEISLGEFLQEEFKT